MNVKDSFSVEKARKAQLRLSEKIISEDALPEKIRLVAGVDVAYTKEIAISAVAVLDYDSLKLVESQTAHHKTCFPYISTLLSFREIPPTISGIRKLQVSPDVFLVDGHGVAHPYRCGFASHLGLVIGKPTIGVAKSGLLREVKEINNGKNVSLLKHKEEIVGAKIIIRHECKPLYVSIGHMISLETAIKVVKHCIHQSHIPEPILKAHKLATLEKAKNQ